MAQPLSSSEENPRFLSLPVVGPGGWAGHGAKPDSLAHLPMSLLSFAVESMFVLLSGPFQRKWFQTLLYNCCTHGGSELTGFWSSTASRCWCRRRNVGLARRASSWSCVVFMFKESRVAYYLHLLCVSLHHRGHSSLSWTGTAPCEKPTCHWKCISAGTHLFNGLSWNSYSPKLKEIPEWP